MTEQNPPPAAVLPAPQNRKDPGQYRCRWTPFTPATIAISVLILGGGYLLARGGTVPIIVAYVLICTMVGLLFTLVAMAWGALISLTESPQCGLLFIVFPPYLFYYSITRWRWMSQPMVLFLCGLGLMAGAIVTGQWLLAEFAQS